METTQNILHQVFSYSDYRHFLSDFFAAKKEEGMGFSHRAFAKWAGFSAHNFISLVLRGKRNLSRTSIDKLAQALKMSNKEAKFFENLVFLNQAKSADEKDRYYEALRKIGRKVASHKVDEEHFFFYEKWYYPVIRELMVLVDWQEDPAKLAKMITPQISTASTRDAVDKLLSSEMVCKNDDGGYRLTHEFVSSESVPTYIKKKSRRDVLRLGAEITDEVLPQDKYAAYATLPMSRKMYEETRDFLDKVRAEILSGSTSDENPEEVYEMVLQLFPVTQIKKGDK